MAARGAAMCLVTLVVLICAPPRGVFQRTCRLVDMAASRHVPSSSEGWWIRLRWFGARSSSSHPVGLAGAGDAGGCGDVQGAVGFHAEAPALGEGLQPMVGAAQAAEVGAGSDATL